MFIVDYYVLSNYDDKFSQMPISLSIKSVKMQISGIFAKISALPQKEIKPEWELLIW